ncbi:K02A2.6-like, partial [Cordylochernes scorpioides]
MASYQFKEYNEETETFETFYERLEQFLILEEAGDEKKKAYLLTLMGSKTYGVLKNLCSPILPKDKTFDNLIDILKRHFSPKRSIVVERFIFFKRMQLKEESISDYLVEIKRLASSCNFGNFLEDSLRDKMVCGLYNAKIQNRILSEGDISLAKVIEIALSMEAAEKNTKLFHLEQGEDCVDKLRMERKVESNFQNGKCKHCGKLHRELCRFKEAICFKCNKKGHIASICWSSRRNLRQHQNQPGNIHQIGDQEEEEEPSELALHGNVAENWRRFKQRLMLYLEATEKATKPDKLKVAILLNFIGEEALEVFNTFHLKEDEAENFDLVINKFDDFCEPKKNVIFERFKFFSATQKDGESIDSFITELKGLSKIERPSTKVCRKSKENFETFGSRRQHHVAGHEIKIKGIATLNCKTKNKTESLEFFIADGYYQPILGIEAIEKLSLIKKCDAVQTEQNNSAKEILNRHKNIFEGIGRLPIEHKIRLKENATPVIAPSRKIPFSIREKVKAELERMEKLDIIEKVEEPSEWTHPIVVVQKPSGDVRICMDPRELNKYVQRERYILPTAETIFSELKGATVFSVFDASSAFWQVPLDKESTNLCTIATPFGRFRFKRLPYGLNSASEVFQRCINNILSGLQGTACYMDDILIYGNTMEEHNRNLETVLRRLEENNVKLNAKKQQIAVNKVNFLGHIISRDGIAIQASRAEAIQKLKRPENKTEVQRFLGMVTYLGKFIPNLSDKTAPLRKLISNKSEWKFGGEENDCFEKLKNMVSNAPILTFFDPTKPITISSDASQYGIGTVLMQGGHAIEYASFSLNATQRKYAQIEKELLAIVFGCERFQYYIWGNDVIVETDHKPLLSIVKKPLEKLSPRLQRMVLRLMRFQISLKFTPGKNMFVADHLSRDPLKDEVDTSYLEGQTESVHMLLVTTDEKIKRLQKETHGDHTLIQLIEYAKNGWPKYKTKVCDEAKPYWQFQDEIHVSDGIVYKGNCIMVPSTLRKEILQVVHSSHQGIAASKEKARSAFYWPGMITQVENEVEKCRTCQEYSRKNPEESRIAHEIPEFPWEKIAVDFMEVSGTSSILVVDYHSKFVEIRKLSSKRETETIMQLKTIFRTHGIPRTLVSDNGPPFNSTGFKNFAQKYEFKHQTSSPKYPRSNGQVERTIQTIKGLIIKAVKSGRDPNLALMEFNNTPKYDLPSPTQMLMGRSVRTLSTYTRQQLKPLFDTTKNYQKLRDHQQKYAGSPKRILRPLEVGDNIMLQERHRKWVPATVTAKHETPRSYMVKTPSGSEYRRNRSHLRPRKFSVEDSAPTSQSPSIPGSQAGTAMDDNIQDHGRPTSENRRAYDPRENVAKKGEESSTSPSVRTRSGRTENQALFVETTEPIKGFTFSVNMCDVNPIFHKARPVPFAIRPAVTEALDKMVAKGYLCEVASSKWATPVVVVPKKNKEIRICCDFKVTLNKYLDTAAYPLPTQQDLFSTLAKGKYFSKLDLRNAYLQLEVDPGTRPLLTINTHKGLFRFKRMPFGLANAPSYFQSVMDRVLSGIGGVICYIDDVLIATASIEEHLVLLKTIFARLAKYNIKLKKEKCLFLQKEIEYLGHLVTGEGIRPLDHKVQAIQKAKTPTNISELRSFLGLVNFYGKFIPNLPELLKPLHELLHKKRPWVWTKECGEAIDKCKNSITSERVLVPYDATLPLCLATDASQIGVGAVLSHIIEGQERPIMFASRTLSEAEQNYSQIEKEALAIIYGVTKFQQFIYGRKFILITDHKPLVTILGSRSGIPTLSTSRLQRWALILSAYTYDIKFRRTQDHGNADLLSRFPVGCEEIPRLNNVYTLSYVEELPITAEEIATETEKEEVLSLAKFYTQQGWPEKVADHLRPYFQRKLELTVDGECLVWGMRVVIPPSLRIKMLNCLHETHSGMNKMKAVARSHFWWPNLDTQIEFLVNKCRSCQQSQDGPNKGKWQPWRWSTRPWQRIHIDFANKENINLLIVVDSHSKWIEAIPMRETTTRKTIEQLRRLFSSYGLPEELVSDNGPQFTGSEMKGFLEGNGIKQTLIPAYHPQSNGLAERAVRTIKTALDKNKRKIGDTIQDTLSKVLLAYRSTPHVTTGKTPSELFIGRALRTRVALIHPSLASRVRDQQARQMKYDRRTHLEEFQIDDLVWCKNFRGGDKCIPGKIVGKKGTRVYTILIHGQVKAYHRDQIRKRWRNGEEDESGDGERQPEHSRGAGPSAIISEVVRDRGYMESLSPGLTSQRSDQDSEVQSDTDDGKSLEPLRSLDPEALKEEGPVLRRNPPRARRPPGDVRHDEDQQLKFQEIIELFLAAGYFRARIKGLADFDKCQWVRTSAPSQLLWNPSYWEAYVFLLAKCLVVCCQIVGGMTWCIEVCNVDIDVDLLFQENLNIGQK